jgi:hypothetical protein
VDVIKPEIASGMALSRSWSKKVSCERDDILLKEPMNQEANTTSDLANF